MTINFKEVRMTKLSIKYNPYTVESEILMNGALVQAPNKLYDLRKERIQVWIEDLLPILDEMCNDDEYIIDFYGTRLDYEDVNVVLQEQCKKYRDIDVTINFTEGKGTEDCFKELKELFNDMQKNCPFEDLKTEQIKENFQKAISSEFEVSVIATMSSGKSTLINSLLGRELMPSKNEACTATIAKIKDCDDMTNFNAYYMDKEGKRLGEYEDLSLDDMVEMNEDERTAYINIEGNIPNIDSSGVQLVLVDTPGPNNSRTEEHKNHTYRVIKEKSKPLILYVLNATQLQTNDDQELLSTVSDAMRVGGKQSKDRFLFAVNKIDQFDPDKESVAGALDNVREYLKKFDIENPNIFPTSAEMAKVIRMYQNGHTLTKGQNRTLRDYDLFIDEEQLHLSEQASLSQNNMRKIKQAIEDAKDSGDEYQEALLYTGIPAVEYAIDEYLKKYAYTAKVKMAVDTFRKKVEEKDMRAKMMASIQNDEEARRKINEQLKQVQKLLEEGSAGKQFRQKIQNLDMMKDADAKIQSLRRRINDISKTQSASGKMETLAVQQLLMRLNKRISSLQCDIKTELENIIDDVIVQNGKVIVDDYKKHMHELISSGALESGEYSATNGIGFLEEDLPDAQELIDQYKVVERVDTGEVEWVKNNDHKWWDFFELFEPRRVAKNIFKDVEMVDVEKVYEDYVDPIISSFIKNLNNARKAAQENADGFKKFFLAELDKLEEVLRAKVEENEALTRNQSSIEEKIAADKQKVEWLEDFLKRLDTILSI